MHSFTAFVLMDSVNTAHFLKHTEKSLVSSLKNMLKTTFITKNKNYDYLNSLFTFRASELKIYKEFIASHSNRSLSWPSGRRPCITWKTIVSKSFVRFSVWSQKLDLFKSKSLISSKDFLLYCNRAQTTIFLTKFWDLWFLTRNSIKNFNTIVWRTPQP